MPRTLRRFIGLLRVAALCGTLTAADGAPAEGSSEGAPAPTALLELPVPDAVFTKMDRWWMGVYMYGHKAGWAVESLGPAVVEERPCVCRSSEMTTELKAMQRILRRSISTRRCYWKDPPYRAFLIEYTEKMGEHVRRVVLRSEAGSDYSMEITEGGKTKSGTHIRLDARLCQETSFSQWAASPSRRPGDAMTFAAFSPVGVLHHGAQTATILKEARWPGSSGKTPLWEIEAADPELESSNLLRVSRRDGRSVSIVTEGGMELKLEPEKTAKRMPEIVPDVYVLRSIGCSRRLGDPGALSELVLELTAPEGRRVPDLPDTVNQTVQRNPNGSVTVKITRGGGKPQPATVEEREAALRASGRYPLTDETVRKLAAEAVNGATDDRTKVQKLLQFTRSYIQDALNAKALGVMDVIQSKRGDCTAHTLLFTTLARAAGVPAREAGGWMYSGDRNRAFGGHAWSEVILDGQWIPVDSVFTEMQLSAGHIQEYSAGTAGPRQREFVPNLKARVVSFDATK